MRSHQTERRCTCHAASPPTPPVVPSTRDRPTAAAGCPATAAAATARTPVYLSKLARRRYNRLADSRRARQHWGRRPPQSLATCEVTHCCRPERAPSLVPTVASPVERARRQQLSFRNSEGTGTEPRQLAPLQDSLDVCAGAADLVHERLPEWSLQMW